MMTNAQAAALATATLLQSHGSSTHETTWVEWYDFILDSIEETDTTTQPKPDLTDYERDGRVSFIAHAPKVGND